MPSSIVSGIQPLNRPLTTRRQVPAGASALPHQYAGVSGCKPLCDPHVSLEYGGVDLSGRPLRDAVANVRATRPRVPAGTDLGRVF